MIAEIIPGADITVGADLMKYSPEVFAPQKGALNIDRARQELGYRPQYALFEGLKKYMELLQKGRWRKKPAPERRTRKRGNRRG